MLRAEATTERDELISQLPKGLEKVQYLQKTSASKVDKCTQTELLGYDNLWDSTCTNLTSYVFQPRLNHRLTIGVHNESVTC